MGEDDYGWYDDPGWEDPGTGDPVAVDPGIDPGTDPVTIDPGTVQDYFDSLYSDFTGTDENGIVWENGEVVGMDLGDGTWATLDGEILDANGNSVGFVDGTNASNQGGSGFLDSVGNFFKNLFGGSGGANGAGSAAMGQLAGKAQQAAQNLAKAQQQGASPQTLQALQRQLAMAQQAMNRVQGGIEPTTLLLIGAAGVGAYMLARRR